MKSSQPRRDWSAANVKRQGICRACGEICGRLELVHLSGRTYDRVHPTRKGWLLVDPDSVITLGGPATDPTTCHGAFDAGRLDLLGKLSREEEVRTVADLGLERARVRLCPSDYTPAIVEARGQAMERIT